MRRHYVILLFAVITLSLHMVCLDFQGMNVGVPEYNTYPVSVRNTSTSSGVTLNLPPWYYEGGGLNITLDAAPQPGVPVDSSGTVLGPHLFNWRLVRTVDSTVVATGEIYIDSRMWALIEENNGEWTCTWSDDGWE